MNKFKLKFVGISIEDLDNELAQFKLKTKKGEMIVAEWMSYDSNDEFYDIKRTDSNMKLNQSEEIEQLIGKEYSIGDVQDEMYNFLCDKNILKGE